MDKVFNNKRVAFYIVFSLFISLSLQACHSKAVYKNSPEDYTVGKEVLNNFFTYLKNHNSAALDSMIDKKAISLDGPGGFSNLLNEVYAKAGDYQSYIEVDHYTENITGDTNRTTYLFKLRVNYQKDTVNEIIGFRKVNGSQIKLFSYHLNAK